MLAPRHLRRRPRDVPVHFTPRERWLTLGLVALFLALSGLFAAAC